MSLHRCNLPLDVLPALRQLILCLLAPQPVCQAERWAGGEWAPEGSRKAREGS